MLIENYKGIDIKHNALKDEFYTSLTITSPGMKQEVIKGGRLQNVRNRIDQFLNVQLKNKNHGRNSR